MSCSRHPDATAGDEVSEASCPDCGSSIYQDGRCGACAIRRMSEQHRQMSQRSGPQYDLAVSRSRTGTAAWRAAGSPARVTMVTGGSIDADGNYHGERKWYLTALYKRGERIEATPGVVQEPLHLLAGERPRLRIALVVIEVSDRVPLMRDRHRIPAGTERLFTRLRPTVPAVHQELAELAQRALVAADRGRRQMLLGHQVQRPLVHVPRRPSPRILTGEIAEPAHEPHPRRDRVLPQPAGGLLRTRARQHRLRPCRDLTESPRDASASKNAVTAASPRPSIPAGPPPPRARPSRNSRAPCSYRPIVRGASWRSVTSQWR